MFRAGCLHDYFKLPSVAVFVALQSLDCAWGIAGSGAYMAGTKSMCYIWYFLRGSVMGKRYLEPGVLEQWT